MHTSCEDGSPHFTQVLFGNPDNFLLLCTLILTTSVMSKKLIWILAIVMTATIVWMIFIQASWFKTSFSLRQHQFSEQVMHALDGVVKQLDQREVFRQLNNEVIALSFDTVPTLQNTNINRPAPEIVGDALRDADTANAKNSNAAIRELLHVLFTIYQLCSVKLCFHTSINNIMNSYISYELRKNV